MLLLLRSDDDDFYTFTQVMITGLHTCGSLAPICLRLFCEDGGQLGGQRRGQLASNEAAAKVLCNVGCCYHWLNEVTLHHRVLHHCVLHHPRGEQPPPLSPSVMPDMPPDML